MQRDAYAILIKKKGKVTLPINILQLSGEITKETIFDEVFDGYKARRIVLMTHMAATTGRFPRDIVIADFAKLQEFHQAHYTYKLLPLLCACYSTFALLQAIATSAGAPFSLDQRKDPSPLRMTLGNNRCASNKELIASFFDDVLSVEEKAKPLAQRKLPVDGIDYSGLFLNLEHGGHLGLVALHKVVTPAIVQSFSEMNRFFNSSFFVEKKFLCVPLHGDTLRCKHRYYFLGADKVVDRSAVLARARDHGIFVFERDSRGEYSYSNSHITS